MPKIINSEIPAISKKFVSLHFNDDLKNYNNYILDHLIIELPYDFSV